MPKTTHIEIEARYISDLMPHRNASGNPGVTLTIGDVDLEAAEDIIRSAFSAMTELCGDNREAALEYLLNDIVRETFTFPDVMAAARSLLADEEAVA